MIKMSLFVSGLILNESLLASSNTSQVVFIKAIHLSAYRSLTAAQCLCFHSLVCVFMVYHFGESSSLSLSEAQLQVPSNFFAVIFSSPLRPWMPDTATYCS